MENITKMIQAAQQSKPADFAKSFNAETNGRVIENIKSMRSDVVGSMFATNPGGSDE